MPPPPIVKSSILGDFPLPGHKMTTIAEEESENIDETQKQSDLEEEEEEEENDFEDRVGTAVGNAWYEVIDGPFPNSPVTNHNEANSVHNLTVQLYGMAWKIRGSSRML
ncbi:hypothetical protein DFH28DRAFT_224424 [Melampsora americana]|nr:hypothetical protein DFH28DRAFT_224424 [Melampsora americana]